MNDNQKAIVLVLVTVIMSLLAYKFGILDDYMGSYLVVLTTALYHITLAK